MPVHLPKYKLTYISVPKVACSSLKQFFFQIENGFRFRAFRMNGRRYIIHTLAPCTAFKRVDKSLMRGHAKIAVVRDPASRIISCYTNKIRNERKLHGLAFTKQQTRSGLVADPTLDNFIDLLPQYAAVSASIHHHSRPLSHFLGRDPAFFDRLFSIRQLSDLTSYVAEKVGEVPKLPHRNKSGGTDTDLSADELNRNKRRIEEMYSEDLEIFGAYM